MLQKIKICFASITLFIFSSVVLRAEDVPFQMSYTAVNMQFGSNLAHFLSELEQNKFSNKDVAGLLLYEKKATFFSELNQSLVRIKSIGEVSDPDTFYKVCSPNTIANQETSINLEKTIHQSLDRYCRYLFLNRLMQLSSSINFSSRDLNFFKQSAIFYINGEHKAELALFLRKFKINTLESEKLSVILQQKFIEYKIRPPTVILSQMNITQDFNSFLQMNVNLDDKSSKVFLEEYQHTTRNAKNALEKGDYSLAMQLTKSNISFYKNNKNFISDDKAWDGITQVAKSLYLHGREQESQELFSSAQSIASSEKQQESTFHLLWPAIVTRDDKLLLEVVQKNGLEKSFSKFGSKLQYWIAYAFYQNGDQQKSFELFNKIIASTPFSFYSILSLKILALKEKGKLSEHAVMTKLINKSSLPEHSMTEVSETLKQSLRRLAIWQKLENEKLISTEVRYIRMLPKNEVFKNTQLAEKMTDVQSRDFVTINLVRLLNSKHQFLSSFKIFKESLDQNSLALNFKLIKYIFPLSYIDIIKKNARNIDPLVIISLIRQESSFNPNANSPVGAKGLMQLMPATARRFNPRLRTQHLNNPEINIAIGIKYFKQLLTRYDGNLIFSLAAYNAGENRIDRWKKEIFKSEDPLAIIEAIPFEETRNYVKFIYRNYFFYSMISDKSILMTPIQDSFKVSLKH